MDQAALLFDAIEPSSHERVTRAGKGVCIAAHIFTQRTYIDFEAAELVSIAYQPFLESLGMGSRWNCSASVCFSVSSLVALATASSTMGAWQIIPWLASRQARP